MAQWGNSDTQNDAPKYVVDATTGKTGIQQYGNTVFGYTPTEAGAADEGLASPGWVKIRKGTGNVTDLIITTAGVGYANGDTITAGPETAEITTNANGAITSLDFTPSGDPVTAVPTVSITTAAGENAVITVVTNGQIGRFWSETLVAMRGME